METDPGQYLGFGIDSDFDVKSSLSDSQKASLRRPQNPVQGHLSRLKSEGAMA